MDDIKLLVVADTYRPKVDGTLVFMNEFLKRVKGSFDISLLVPDMKGRKGKEKFPVTFMKLSKWLEMSGYPQMKLSWSNLRKIKGAVNDTDVVFAQGPALLSYLALYYGHKYGKKTVFYPHVLSWEVFEKHSFFGLTRFLTPIVKKLSLYFYNKCDKILVPYHGLVEHLKEEGVKAPMQVAKLGVDIKRFSPMKEKSVAKQRIGIHRGKTVIGYVGRLSREKNIGVLVDAFRKLDEPEQLLLLLVGDGEKEFKKELNLPPNCKITGFVENVQDYLHAMDIFVMPSLTETTSLATLEAMSSGLPVIATKVGFIQKYVQKDHNGMFFPKNSPSMLAIKLEKLVNNGALREELGDNARKTIAYSFSWERSINKIKRLVLRVVLRE
jgi:glycosyltransferase involved in cell wall biosynthesis